MSSPVGPVMVINRLEDVQRLARMRRRLDAQGITFTRIEGEPPPEPLEVSRILPGHFGCARAHGSAIAHAARSGWEHAIVMEDDCVIRDDFVDMAHIVGLELEDLEWDVIHFGAKVVRCGPRHSRHIMRLEVGWHAHCYAVHSRAYARVHEWTHRTSRTQGWYFDSFAIPNLVRLVVQPTLAVQEPGISNTEQRHMDRLAEELPTAKERNAFAKYSAEMRTWRL